MKKDSICEQWQGERRTFVNVSTEFRFSYNASLVFTERGSATCEEELRGLCKLGSVNKVAVNCDLYFRSVMWNVYGKFTILLQKSLGWGIVRYRFVRYRTVRYRTVRHRSWSVEIISKQLTEILCEIISLALGLAHFRITFLQQPLPC